MRKTGKWRKRLISAALSAAVLVSMLMTYPPIPTDAADKNLTLDEARALALRNDASYEAAKMQVEAKKAERESAVKAVKMRQKSMSTLHWSPLQSISVSEKPNLSEASEFEFKPVQLAGEVQVAERKVQDELYGLSEEVNNLYVEIVTLQEKNAYAEDRYKRLESGIAHTRKMIKTGEATEGDLERQQKKLDELTGRISADRRTLEADLKRLSEMTGLDVTTGYTFERPYTEATIQRSMLPALITYTEDRDATYYEACIASLTAKLELSINYELMESRYKKDIHMISRYVSDALAGREVNSRSFKNDYQKFLEQVDSYWEGDKKICRFIEIPKEWMKGSLDGTRYIEDDPYVLYQNVLDYVSAREEEEAARAELDRKIEEAFNSYINIRSSYQKYLTEQTEAGSRAKQYEAQNRMGELTQEEYENAVEEYENYQDSLLEAMKLYTQTFYSFDRLTCGAVSALLSGTDPELNVAAEGESYIKRDKKEAQYYLKPIIQRELFELSVYIPKDFPVTVTHFELWCDDQRIGDRTPVDGSIRHMALTRENIGQVRIRLYSGEEFVDDCVIDPNDENGVLSIVTAMSLNKEETGIVGSFLTRISETTGMASITFTPLESEGIAYYRVLTETGKTLGSRERANIHEEFRHLGLVSADLDKLSIEFYDTSEKLLYIAYMDTGSGKLKKRVTE